MLVYMQRAGSSCSLPCLVVTAARSCADVERREGINICNTDRKLATMTTALTAALSAYMIYID